MSELYWGIEFLKGQIRSTQTSIAGRISGQKRGLVKSEESEMFIKRDREIVVGLKIALKVLEERNLIDKPIRLEDKKIKTKERLDRIDRMLRWLILRKRIDYLGGDLDNPENKEHKSRILDRMFSLAELMPDISDIIKEKNIKAVRK